MAQVVPMDTDDMESDFDNKENSFHHSNVLLQTPRWEQAHEQLDVSELNMKLRYSMTPASSPMSRSLNDFESDTNSAVACSNLTRSFNSTITKSEMTNTLKSLPLQVITSDKEIDDSSPSVLNRAKPGSDKSSQDITPEAIIHNDDNMSLPSTSSSLIHTPEATTPTKEASKHDGSSPIMRGLKSVLNMFRSSQSPIPPEGTITNLKQDILITNDSIVKDMESKEDRYESVVVSTPIPNKRKSASGSRRSSPLKESIVFSEDLETDLQWKDETTIFFKDEKIPIHKLFPCQSMGSSKTSKDIAKPLKMGKNESKNTTEEYMSMSNDASLCQSGNTINRQNSYLQNEVSALESDGEFVDCEMTLNGELTQKEDNACDETNNDNKLIHENTKQVIDNIDHILTDCEEQKAFVVDGPKTRCQVSEGVSTAVHCEQYTLLTHNTSDQKLFESEKNIVNETLSTCEGVVEHNAVNTFVSVHESMESTKTNDLSADDCITPTNVTLCQDNVDKHDLNNDYNKKTYASEVSLADDNYVDFMEFPRTTEDINEPKTISAVGQDLNKTAMSVDYSDSKTMQEASCELVPDECKPRLGQDNDLKTTDNTKVSVTKETMLQQECLHKEENSMESKITDSIGSPVNLSFNPEITDINENQSKTTAVKNDTTKVEDTLRPKSAADTDTVHGKLSSGAFQNELSRTSLCGSGQLSIDHYRRTTEQASLSNRGMLNTAPNEVNASRVQTSVDGSSINDRQQTTNTFPIINDLKESDKESNGFKNVPDKVEESVVMESNISKLMLPDTLTKFDTTHSIDRDGCALDATFDMDAVKKVNIEEVINNDEVKTHVKDKAFQDIVIRHLSESSTKYQVPDKDCNTKIEKKMHSIADKENGTTKVLSESEVSNQSKCSNNTDMYVSSCVDPVIPEEDEHLQLEHSLRENETLDYVNKINITTETSCNLPDPDTLFETIEIFPCQTEETSNFKYAMSKYDDTSPERTAADTSSNEKVNDGIIASNNMLPVKDSEPKNVFNLPEMSSTFVSNLSEIVSTTSTPDAEAGSKHIFKAPSSDLAHRPQTLNSAHEVDRKLCADKNELDSSDVSTSSRASEATVHEVNTEDDDTVEACFFESEEFNDVDKKSDHEDMIDFSDIPTRKVINNVYKGEMFIDAEAFQFLLNQNKSNVVADSGRESLFLKFDPLFAKRMSTDAAEVNEIKKDQSTPKRLSKALSNIEFYRNPNETTENTLQANFEDATVLLSKPMMVVNPAVNSVFSPRNKSCTPPRRNRRSHAFTSPAIAVIDRLLSLSGDSSALDLEISMSDVRGRTNETDQVLTQLRELLAEKEINVHGLRSESKALSERLRTLESQVRILETESEQRFRKVDDLDKCLAEKTKMNKGMAVVVEEYERTIASLTAEIEQDKKAHAEERMKLINERNEQNAHLASMTMSFNDLHSKYEKNKQIILNCKANEDKYKVSMKEFEESVMKIQNNYDLLKQHAASNLNNKNDELDKLNRTHEAEVLKYGAMIKRKEMDICSLKETLAQKIKANEELTAICDELLYKVA